jgi:hypothetical protein
MKDKDCQTIPCKECLVLAACKSKKQILCNILYQFMDNNINYEDRSGEMIYTECANSAWEQIEELFQKSDTDISLVTGGRNPEYLIESIVKKERSKKDF